MDRKKLRSRLLASSFIAGSMAFAAPGAFAQEEEDAEARQETVLVTGSRIAKQDFVSNSPIATVDAEVFELTGSVNTEDVLNTLPQAVPGFDRTSNNPGGGFATANLRGLGSSRTLVLVDGKRFVPTTSGGVVDLNNIPPALIERVEVITGGASAVYGSDAVSGVVNFILKDDFEGFEANLGYEATVDNGDSEYYNADVTFGTNFDNDRGNVTMNIGYTNRKAVFQGDRDFSTFALGDDGAGGFVEFGSSGVPAGHSFDSFTFSDGSTGQAIFDSSAPGGVRQWINSGPGNDRYNYAPVNYLQLPQERFTTTSIASYDINDDVELYGRFTGAFNQVPQQLAPTPAFTSVTTALDNPFLTPEQSALLGQLDTDGDGSITTFVGRRMVETGERRSNDDFFAFQVQTGIRGTILDSMDYDVYFQTGRTQDNVDLQGDISLSRYLDAVNVTDDGSGNPVCVSGNSACVPMDIWGAGDISDAAADYVRANLNAKSEYNQTVFGATLSGDTEALFSLPGGPVGWAFGAEYREEEFDFRPDDNLGSGNLLGFNAAPGLTGGFDVYDVYGEFYAPIFRDQPGVELLALEGAFRVSDYSTVGQTETYKIGGEYAPIDGLRFRGLYNTAVRAPNIGELFSAVGNGFPAATDPCSASQNPAAAGIATLCTATGVPNVGVYEQRNNQIEGLFGGNPDLEPEEADTYTIGAVWQPAFADGLSVSVDYYSIEISEYITTLAGGVQGILNQCYDSANNPSQDPNTVFCQATNRGPSGEPLVLSNLANAGSLETAGIDLVVDYQFELDAIPGTLGLSYTALFLDKWDFYAFEGAEVDDCAGQFGLFCDDPVPDYKHNASVSWANGPFTAQLRWEHIGSVTDDNPDVDYSVEDIDSFNYFNLAGTWDVNDNLRLTAGLDNVLDEEPPIIGDNQEQANTYPATYDPFGRTAYLSAKIRF